MRPVPQMDLEILHSHTGPWCVQLAGTIQTPDSGEILVREEPCLVVDGDGHAVGGVYRSVLHRRFKPVVRIRLFEVG